jgi:hypothetical protein
MYRGFVWGAAHNAPAAAVCAFGAIGGVLLFAKPFVDSSSFERD